MISFGGSSRQSLANLRTSLDEKVKPLLAGDCAAVSADLFGVLGVLNSSIGLRRALTDPSRDLESKRILLEDLFGKVIGKVSMELLIVGVSLRWSSPLQFADAVEQIAVEAEASAANLTDDLDRVQDEIFEFSRILLANGDLRQALSARTDDASHKQALVDEIFASKFAPSALRLVSAVVAGLRGRSIEQTVETYSHAIAARRNRVTVYVRSAIALSDSQRGKLVNALTKQIGQPVHINVEIDPSVIGGVVIRFADEVIDGTIVNRLAEASRALVG
jgi:F-type H+-transporting ATPase subunit delta